jgi:cytochrome P450
MTDRSADVQADLQADPNADFRLSKGIDRQAWLEAAPARSPEMEQVLFGANVAEADQLSLEEINPFNAHLFQQHRWHGHFARLRHEDPIHFNELGSAGRYWSITRWEDIRRVEYDWETFSSAQGITLAPGTRVPDAVQIQAFITMDPPEHMAQRKTVRKIASIDSVRNLEAMVRERTAGLLDSLPVGETFDWVDTVSMELTSLMLATLFDFPIEDRRKLTHWSDVVFAVPRPGGVIETYEQRRDEFQAIIDYFEWLWEERRQNPGHDLVSMLVHGDATKHLPTAAHLGNLLLLIVGGNDTTRNTMTGSVYGLNRFGDQYDRLLDDPGLVANLVPEIIRWQTPLAYMRRTATVDTELDGREIQAGDQVLLWYVSANRDEEIFGHNADDIVLDRPNADRHLAFGYGIHHCMGSRLAELQLRVLWEEILGRFGRIEVQGEPERILSSFVNGYANLPVRITSRR